MPLVRNHGGVKTTEDRPAPERAKREAGEPRTDAAHRFDDPYWDEVFDTLYDPTMRVCSAFGC